MLFVAKRIKLNGFFRPPRSSPLPVYLTSYPTAGIIVLKAWVVFSFAIEMALLGR